jgi:hypothetical protein
VLRDVVKTSGLQAVLPILPVPPTGQLSPQHRSRSMLSVGGRLHGGAPPWRRPRHRSCLASPPASSNSSGGDPEFVPRDSAATFLQFLPRLPPFFEQTVFGFAGRRDPCSRRGTGTAPPRGSFASYLTEFAKNGQVCIWQAKD